MKFLFTFFFFSFLSIGFSQDMVLVKVDSTLKFRFEYSLCFQNKEDSSTYALEIDEAYETDGKSNSFSGTVFDNQGKPVPIARVEFKYENGTVFQTKTNLQGDFSIQIPAGHFEISCLSMNHDILRFEADVLANEHYILNCKMGSAPELITYKINAVNQLTEEEIAVIMNCIKINRDDPYKSCSVLGEYYVTIKI